MPSTTTTTGKAPPGEWVTVSKAEPCAICGKTRWCRQSADGQIHECHKTTGEVAGFAFIKATASGFGLYRDPNGDGTPRRSTGGGDKPRKAFPTLRAAANNVKGRMAGVWAYHRADGSKALFVVRFDLPNGDKTFRPFHKTPDGWVMADPPGKLPLYGLPDLLAAAGTVYVAEGEKAAEAARMLGLNATTSAHGCKAAHMTDWTPLAGRDVVVLSDNDDPGRAHAHNVADTLVKLDPPATVRICELPGLPHAGDIVDFIDAHPEDAREQIERLVAEAPPSDPPQEEPDGDQPAEGFHLTDLGNAKRLVHRFGNNFHHCHELGPLVWDGRRWARDTAGRLDQLAKKTVLGIYGAAAECQNQDRREALAKWAAKSESAKRIRDTIALALTEPGIPISTEQLDAAPWLLNVANGTLNLKTGELCPHRREDFNTKLVPVKYDSNAACPIFDRFLKRVTGGDEDVAGFLRRAVGYSLTADTSEQCLFFLYGLGQNGKTTFLKAIIGCLGDYARQADFNTFLLKRGDTIPNDIARLVGCRFVCATEVEAGKRLAEVLVKQLTGGDRVAARFLHREFFEFDPTFKIWLGGNHKPVIRGTDLAVWRRIRLIPFVVTIPKEDRDPHLIGKLRAELPGVLAWAIRGCREWQEHGLDTPNVVQDATAAYRTEMDILGGFIEDYCIVASATQTTIKGLYAAYGDWCEANGERALSKNVFSARLAERGFEPNRIGRARGYRGIGLIEGD